jgi:hypothetical protein
MNDTPAPPQPPLSSTISHGPMRCIRNRHSPSSVFSNGMLPSSAKAMWKTASH